MELTTIALSTMLYVGLIIFIPPIVISYCALTHYENKIVHTDKDLHRIDIFERINLLSWVLLTGYLAMLTFLLYHQTQIGN